MNDLKVAGAMSPLPVLEGILEDQVIILGRMVQRTPAWVSGRFGMPQKVLARSAQYERR